MRLSIASGCAPGKEGQRPHSQAQNQPDIDKDPHQGYAVPMKNDPQSPLAAYAQRRMLQPGELLDAQGRLMEAGYATQLIKRYDRSRIRAPRWRVKEWDYYLIASDYAALALTVSDNGYLGLDSLSIIDFEEKTQRTVSRMQAFPLGKKQLPPDSREGVVRAQGKGYEFTFRCDGGQRHLYGHIYDFGPGKTPLLFDVVLSERPGDSMVIATPFRRRPRHFYYNQKICGLPADGRVIYGEKEYLFSPAASFAVLDWGRGVWPWINTWYWASASGIVQGQPFGLNLGCGFGDTRAATENMLFYGGAAHKLGDVRFEIPGGRRADYLSPWRVRDAQGRLDLVFEPILDRAAKTSLLVIKTDQHQVFGRFSGTAALDSGQVLPLSGLIGFAEKVYMRF